MIIDITAVHNHVLRADPLTFYMHIGGHGDPVKLAAALRAALAESKTPLTAPAAAAPPPAIDLATVAPSSATRRRLRCERCNGPRPCPPGGHGRKAP